jgi:hypothetical protein
MSITMKLKWSLPAFVALFALLIAIACTNKKNEDAKNINTQQDTVGLAEYQKWKMENEKQSPVAQPNQPNHTNSNMVASPSHSSSARNSVSGANATHSGGSGSASAASQGNSNPVAQAPAPQPAKKKGLTQTAKGAIVGAASGAVIGAVANKKDRLGGGVVGGVIGAATGVGIGAIVDKKQKQKTSK